MKTIVLLLVAVLALSGCTAPAPEPAGVQEPSPQGGLPPINNPQPIPDPTPPEAPEPGPAWVAVGNVIPGNYADAEAIALPDGSYRMYYSLEPEVPGFRGQVYSATSTDGLAWTPEGEVMDSATFPSVIRLPDGRYRMYYQRAGVIASSISSDGLTWTAEAGTRVDAENDLGLALDNVAAPTVVLLDGRYVMVYRGMIRERYAPGVPNQNTQLLLWATSADGFTFAKQGMVLDSRNSQFEGLLDGPEFADEEGTTSLYFWSYKGVYHVVFDGSAFSQEATLDFTTGEPSSLVRYPPNPPGDPTLLQAGDTWYLYYGGHTEGIFAARRV